MKITIFFEKSWIELGVFAKIEFLQLFIKDGEEMDAVMEVTADIIEKVLTMNAYNTGFTQMVKDSFLKFLQENIGKKILIVDDWGISKIHQEYYFDVIEHLNNGLDLYKASKVVRDIYEAKIEAVKV